MNPAATVRKASLLQMESHHAQGTSTETILAMSAAFRQAAADTHRILDAHGAIELTAHYLQRTWHPVCRRCCDASNMHDVFVASHKQTMALFQTNAVAHVRHEIRQRVKMDLRVQRFIAEHGHRGVCLRDGADDGGINGLLRAMPQGGTPHGGEAQQNRRSHALCRSHTVGKHVSGWSCISRLLRSVARRLHSQAARPAPAAPLVLWRKRPSILALRRPLRRQRSIRGFCFDSRVHQCVQALTRHKCRPGGRNLSLLCDRSLAQSGMLCHGQKCRHERVTLLSLARLRRLASRHVQRRSRRTRCGRWHCQKIGGQWGGGRGLGETDNLWRETCS